MAQPAGPLPGADDRGSSDIAVIGHGRSPEGKGWGGRINACTVIRMWDWCWQARDDYGSRYDYGLFEAHPAMMRTFYENNRADPDKGWVASALFAPERCRLPKNTQLVDQAPWNALGKRLGGKGQTGRLQFTRGTIATCWAIETLAKRGDRIVLVAFDNIRVGRALPLDEAFSKAYQANPGTFSFSSYLENATKYGNHDYAIELPVMRHLAARHGVEIAFAQDIW